MKRILVPTDFSRPAQMALETAVALSKTSGAELALLHVVDQPNSESYNIEGEVMPDGQSWENRIFTMKLIERSKKLLDKAAEGVKNSGVRVTKVLRLGNPFHGIHTVINEQKVDLIVMGTEGHSKLEKMLIGSNTEKVVRTAHCPVLTVHQKPAAVSFKNIVYATSLIKDEDPFSKVVAEMQGLFDSRLHVVWINTPETFQPHDVANKALQDFAKRLKLRNYTLNIFNDYTEEAGILQFAESINADLIAMATHGRRGLSRILAGSLAEKISSKARRPVLTAVVK